MRFWYAFFASMVLVIISTGAQAADTDGDGWADSIDNCDDNVNPLQEDGDVDLVGDACDNCTAVANAGQQDSDEDGYGNICDADFNNDGGVGVLDFQVLGDCLGLPGEGARGECLMADINSDHRINDMDYRLFTDLFGGSPGPSAFAP